MDDKVKELFEMIDEIPCLCDNAYRVRKLIDPSCPRCNWIDDDIVVKAKQIIEDEKVSELIAELELRGYYLTLKENLRRIA